MPIILIKIFYLLKIWIKITSHISCFHYTKCDKKYQTNFGLDIFYHIFFNNFLFIKNNIYKTFKIICFSDNILLILDKKYQVHSLFCI